MMTVADLIGELSEFPTYLKVRMQVEVEDTRDPKNPFYYQLLEIKSIKMEDDEVLIEHE